MLFWTQFYAGRFSPSNRYIFSRHRDGMQLNEIVKSQIGRCARANAKTAFLRRKSLCHIVFESFWKYASR